MTTTIRVEAHCGPDEEVEIKVTDRQPVVIENGQSHTEYVYGDKVCTVKERKKVVK